MGDKPRAQGAVGGDLLCQRRVLREGLLDHRALGAVELVIGIGCQHLGRYAHAASPSRASSASRPRTSRELRVPTGQPMIPAASL